MPPSMRTRVTWRASPDPSSLLQNEERTNGQSSSEDRCGVTVASEESRQRSNLALAALIRTRHTVPVGSMTFTSGCRRSFANLALLASSSRLRAPNTSRPLTATLSGARSQSSEGQQRRQSEAPKISERLQNYSESTHTADHNTFFSPSSPSFREEGPLSETYELSRRLIELCQRGDVDLAVTALQEAPRNAQNIRFWNTIIQQCMKARKFHLAYSVFTDVRP
jgi:hypothetical protein